MHMFSDAFRKKYSLALHLVAQVLSPNGVQGAQATGGLDVANNTHNDHGRSLNNGDSLTGLLLVQLGAGLVHLTQNVGAAYMVPTAILVQWLPPSKEGDIPFKGRGRPPHPPPLAGADSC